MNNTMTISNYDQVILIAQLIFVLPLLMFFLLMSLGRVINKFRGIMATIVMFVCTILSFYVFSQTWGESKHLYNIPWFQLSADTTISFGFRIDNLTSLLIVIVTFVSFLVHLFSIEYLRGDRHFEKYFAYLGLFTFSMLGIIMASNLIQIFFFWELVGLCSYLLIGFYFKKESAVFSNKKAFLVNRIGDLGFLLGILIIYSVFNTVDIEQLLQIKKTTNFSALEGGLLTLAGIGFFWGAMGKSAQFPLQVWLPNAMEGPTPISALIHAATMVAAGVYLLARVYFLLSADVLMFVTVIGSITAVIGAFSAISQTDIKRVLAFSTISQLGYMMIAMGVGAYNAGLFHLVTHAFFKACLFLCAGAVIHAMHQVKKSCQSEGKFCDFDTQDMRLMGGLRKTMPVTFWCYVIATASLAGLPFFSGFLSKDAIINASFVWASHHEDFYYYLVPAIGLLTAFMTAFYMFRQVFMVFFNEFRLPNVHSELKEVATKLIEAPILMRVPIIILAIMSISFFFSWNPFNVENSWFFDMILANKNAPSDLHDWHQTTAILSIIISVLGLGSAFYYFGRGDYIKDKITIPIANRNILTRISYNQWYLDKVNDFLYVKPQLMFAKVTAQLDHYVIDGTINFVAYKNEVFAGFFHWVDQSIINRVINFIGIITVVKAAIVEIVEKYIVDGIVRFTGWLFKFAGTIARSFGRGKVQGYILFTILVIGIFFLWYLI